ncbi:MAG: tyrosine-type recombinase/integrase [Thermoleophilia bacterium]
MTAKKASVIRARKMHGDDLPNRERRAKAEAAKQKGTWTMSALWQEYKRAKPDLKDNGSFESIFNKYIDPNFGDKLPKNIPALDIDRLKRRKLKDKSPQTVAHVLELLRRICNFGSKRGLCQGLTFTVEMPKVHNQKTETLTPEQFSNLNDTIDDHIKYQTLIPAAYMMKLALLTGMRRSEMFRLEWSDIDRHQRTITIKNSKGGGDPVIPLSSHAAKLLDRVEKDRNGSPYIFSGRNGGQLVDIKKQVNRIKTEAGLPTDFRGLHGLRHLYSSMLVSNGVSLDVVSRLLTHKGRTVTHRYAHFEDGVLRHAAERAGQLLEHAKSQVDPISLEGLS